MKKTIDKPKVFISYAWGSEDYQAKVQSFAKSLMDVGIEVIFDKWSLKEGNDTYSFMEKTVNDSSITNVLILIDPIYAQKANDKEGGVGTETQIISPEVYEEVEQEKFIPIVFERDEDGNIQKPIFLKNRYHIDLSNNEKYNNEFKRLVRRLYGIDTTPKPELGREPEWLEKEDLLDVDEAMEYSSLKRADNKYRDIEFESKLNSIKKELLKVYLDRENEDVDQIELYSKIVLIRNKYLELIQCIDFVEESEIKVADFLQDIVYELNLDLNNRNEDLFKIAINEWFIYTVSSYLKRKMYKNLNYLFEKTYFTKRIDSAETNHRFSVFRNCYLDRFDKRISDRDDKNYYCGTAQFWIDNIYIKYYSKDDFTFADLLCFNASVYIKDYNESFYWFPLTYVYAEDNYTLRRFVTGFKSHEILKQVIAIFSFDNIDEFKERFNEIDKSKNDKEFSCYRYRNAFNSAPLFNHLIKPEDIGIYN